MSKKTEWARMDHKHNSNIYLNSYQETNYLGTWRVGQSNHICLLTHDGKKYNLNSNVMLNLIQQNETVPQSIISCLYTTSKKEHPK